GDLFEPSGLVSGGKVKDRVDVFAENARFKENSENFEKAKSEKEALVSRLYDLRDKMSDGRKKKAEGDVKLKGIELEIEHLKSQEREMREKQKDLHKAMANLEREMDACTKISENADERRADTIRTLSSLNIQYLEAKQKVDLEKEQQFGNMVKEREHKVSELKISMVRLENEVRQAEVQRAAYGRQLASIERDAGVLYRDVEEAENAARQAEAQIPQDRKLLKTKVEEQKAVSKELRAWIEQREELEKIIVKQAHEKGKLQLDLDKLGSTKQDAELRRVAVETKLSGLTADNLQYDGVEVFRNKTDRAELLLSKKQAEEEMKALGSPNLRSVEQYDQKREELDKQRVRKDQLIQEKNAVMTLIQEIETKKISTFMNTYDQINAAFRKLFKIIFHGEGTLFLENPVNPFLGGLTIQVQLENKEIKYLELMSGGEKSLIALLFLFSIQSYNPSSIYILDEADAALDKENSRKLGLLLKQLSSNSQFLVVSHNEAMYKYADCLVGVAMSHEGSQLVGVRLSEMKS
ncbi:MAG TPA: AAA family ATPase, partial [Candidatus Norongarragalinales archaeon]|nr:AAA family ATPase [Candidatus Norongarragalinales archaeon]